MCAVEKEKIYQADIDLKKYAVLGVSFLLHFTLIAAESLSPELNKTI